ncbi:Hypothetical Protein FCC1311_094372 [Hondaea fermentalgiana]|uniref:Dynein regulatory complex protein 10 n=1 Tax=Hondaea fermentalgiana TaxID=2315210 RepID=A0A2R5GX04_9STRA|nr:Hypothetical Protein FCC1311_094372 [Hondaea fermentalgiana]|eukprot:GBG33213.1 Hypothetical Protein FCC1311_094372 [Hondaea fermentalgiana]
MNKLIRGEASRVIAVLDDSLAALDVVLELPPSGVSGNKLAEAERQWEIAKSNLGKAGFYEARDHLEGLQHAEAQYLKAKRANAREQADLAAAALHEATRHMCRSVRKDPAVGEILAAAATSTPDDVHDERNAADSTAFHGDERLEDARNYEEEKRGRETKSQDSVESKTSYSKRLAVPSPVERTPSRGGMVPGGGGVGMRKEHSLLTLHGTLHEFRKNILDQLSTTVEQKDAQADFFQDLNVRIREMEEDLVLLKNELEVEAVREEELASKKEAEDKLWRAIEEVRSSYEREMVEINTSQAEQKEAVRTSFLERNAKALEAFDKAGEAFVQECVAHGEVEEGLRKKMNRAVAEVNSLIDKYDAVMLEKRAQYELVKRQHKDESARLAVLEEYFRKVDRDLANEAEEERIIAEELAAIEALHKRDNDAAARIQALFRGNQCRRKLKKKKKGKGKGKKGKGKKK